MTKDTQIEGLEEICERVYGVKPTAPSVQLLREILKDPAIAIYIPAVKALQEEVERLKLAAEMIPSLNIELTDELRSLYEGDIEFFAETHRAAIVRHFATLLRESNQRIATLEATNAAQAEQLAEINRLAEARLHQINADRRQYLDLKSQLAGGEAVAWQPIETAPKDGTRVLLWSDKWTAALTGQWYGTQFKITYELGSFTHPPTHWMPLPAAPVDSVEEG